MGSVPTSREDALVALVTQGPSERQKLCDNRADAERARTLLAEHLHREDWGRSQTQTARLQSLHFCSPDTARKVPLRLEWEGKPGILRAQGACKHPHRRVSSRGPCSCRRQDQLLCPERGKGQKSGGQERGTDPGLPQQPRTTASQTGRAQEEAGGEGPSQPEDRDGLAERDRPEEPEASVTLGASANGLGAIRLGATPWEGILARVQPTVTGTQSWEEPSKAPGPTPSLMPGAMSMNCLGSVCAPPMTGSSLPISDTDKSV